MGGCIPPFLWTLKPSVLAGGLMWRHQRTDPHDGTSEIGGIPSIRQCFHFGITVYG